MKARQKMCKKSQNYFQMKQPPPRSLSIATPKSLKEGLVSQMASKFQTSSSMESATKPRRPERISLDSPSPVTSPQRRFSSVDSSRKNDEDRFRKPVTRTESHHTRFNNARALFEKLGSAEELDEPKTCPNTTTTPATATRGRTSPTSARAASVGRSEDNNGHREQKLSTSSAAYFRSRSSSPFSGGGTRSASVQGERPSRTSKSESLSNGDQNGEANGHVVNGGVKEPMGLVKSRRLSFQQKQQEAAEVTTSPSLNGIRSGGGARNWFPTPASAKKDESIESARRTSVKNDSTPNLLSSAKSTASEAIPDQPGDRRPLNASTDSIEEYMKNWKHVPSSPERFDPKLILFDGN